MNEVVRTVPHIVQELVGISETFGGKKDKNREKIIGAQGWCEKGGGKDSIKMNGIVYQI